MLLFNLTRLEKDGIETMDWVTPPTLWDGIMKIYEQIKLTDKAYVLKNQDKCQLPAYFANHKRICYPTPFHHSQEYEIGLIVAV
jgi:hypothetical protein